MRTTSVVMAAAALLSIAVHARQPVTPFKLGTLAQGDRTFIGLVLNDSLVVDLSKADRPCRRR
jgi:hypothetical protein